MDSSTAAFFKEQLIKIVGKENEEKAINLVDNSINPYFTLFTILTKGLTEINSGKWISQILQARFESSAIIKYTPTWTHYWDYIPQPPSISPDIENEILNIHKLIKFRGSSISETDLLKNSSFFSKFHQINNSDNSNMKLSPIFHADSILFYLWHTGWHRGQNIQRIFAQLSNPETVGKLTGVSQESYTRVEHTIGYAKRSGMKESVRQIINMDWVSSDQQSDKEKDKSSDIEQVTVEMQDIEDENNQLDVEIVRNRNVYKLLLFGGPKAMETSPVVADELNAIYGNKGDYIISLVNDTRHSYNKVYQNKGKSQITNQNVQTNISEYNQNNNLNNNSFNNNNSNFNNNNNNNNNSNLYKYLDEEKGSKVDIASVLFPRVLKRLKERGKQLYLKKIEVSRKWSKKVEDSLPVQRTVYQQDIIKKMKKDVHNYIEAEEIAYIPEKVTILSNFIENASPMHVNSPEFKKIICELRNTDEREISLTYLNALSLYLGALLLSELFSLDVIDSTEIHSVKTAIEIGLSELDSHGYKRILKAITDAVKMKKPKGKKNPYNSVDNAVFEISGLLFKINFEKAYKIVRLGLLFIKVLKDYIKESSNESSFIKCKIGNGKIALSLETEPVFVFDISAYAKIK